jgi:hypothetical protein
MAHPILFKTSVVPPINLLLFGLNGTFRPQNHLKALEFPSYTKDTTAQNLNRALMRIWGIRNITVGLLLIAVWTRGDETLMGLGLAIAIGMPITDGFVSRMLIGGGEMQHWLFPPVLAVMAAGLLGVF